LRVAFNRRQTHDYSELAEIDQQTAEETLTNAKTFVAAIESYLRSTGQLASDQESSK